MKTPHQICVVFVLGMAASFLAASACGDTHEVDLSCVVDTDCALKTFVRCCGEEQWCANAAYEPEKNPELHCQPVSCPYVAPTPIEGCQCIERRCKTIYQYQ